MAFGRNARKRVNPRATMHIMRLLSAGAENAGMQESPGLNPRDALDILEIRARDAQSDPAQRTDAGDAVLQYLAQHGAPATRAAVAANPAAPALANRVSVKRNLVVTRINFKNICARCNCPRGSYGCYVVSGFSIGKRGSCWNS